MKSLILKTYVFGFFNHFILIYPLYAVMFTDHGLSTAQVASILMVWSGTVFLLEVPSGVLADKYSRRNILVIGQFARTLGYAIWLLFPGYTGFLVGFLLWGVKSALTHGTLEALIFDELKAVGEESAYARIIGRAGAISFAAVLLASGGAALGSRLGYEFILVCSIVGAVMPGLVALTFHKTTGSNTIGGGQDNKAYLTLLKSGIMTVVRDPAILKIIIFVAFIAGILGTLDEFWPIFANLAGAPNWGIALFVGALSAGQGIASFFAHKMEAVHDRLFYCGVIAAGFILIMASSMMNLWSLGFLILISAMDPIVKVTFEARLQHQIGSQTRATVTSVKGLLIELVALIGLATFGLVSAAVSTPIAFALMGGGIAVVGLGFLVIFRGAGVSPSAPDSRPGE